MKVQEVTRLYTPQCHFVASAKIEAQTPAAILAMGTPLLPVTVPPDMPMRKVWNFFWLASAVGNYELVLDLVATKQGQEVYRQRVMDANQDFSVGNPAIPSTCGRWVSNISVGPPWGPSIESIKVIGGGGTYYVFPWYWNLTCDKIFYEVKTISSPADTWSAKLWVASERGL